LAERFKRHFLKDKELKQLLSQIQQKTRINIQELSSTNPQVEVAESETATIFLINNRPSFARKENMIIPTLGLDEITKFLPQVIVNMGAIPYVCNGADIMAPGVVSAKGDFKKDDFVVIIDEQHQKPLAIGISLHDSEALRSLKHGKIVSNIHFVGDDLWHLLKKFRADDVRTPK
jgi:PUA-domain protein